MRFVQPELGASSGTGTVKAIVVANDPEGKLARVEFYHGETQVSVDTESPFEFTFKDLPTGPQTLRAKAVDAGGKSRTAEVVIQVEAKTSRPEATALQDGDQLLFVGGRQIRHLERHVRWSLGRAGKPLNVRGQTRFEYNATLRELADNKKVSSLLHGAKAKVVVLATGQIQDGNPLVVTNPSVKDMTAFIDLVPKADKQVVLFMTWARNPAGRSGGLEEFRRATEEIVGQVQQVEKQRRVKVMPSGLIFYDLTVDPPATPTGLRQDYLFNTPHSAESSLGLLVNVSALYAVTTGQSPVGLPMWDAYVPTLVKAIQERTWQIVQDWQAGKVVIKPARRAESAAIMTPVPQPRGTDPAWPPLVKQDDRMFFVGNSFTAAQGGLPGHLRHVARHASPALRLETHARIFPGTPLGKMYVDEVVKEIKSKRNAVVVATSGEEADRKRFRELITESGAKMVVHLTWGRNPTINNQGLAGFREQTRRIVESGLALEKETGVAVVPCGLIYWDLIADPPLPGLRQDFVFVYEDIHQNSLGTLANVWAHYAVLTGRSPVGLPTWEPYDQRLVQAVQERVWQVVRDWKERKVTIKPVNRSAR